MKRKFMALFISFAMIFSAAVSIPAKVFAESVDTPSFADFGLNGDSSVNATWDKDTQTLTVTGNGKIDLNKWVELAQKFSENNYKDDDNYGWNTNSNFTMNIADRTVKFPDVTVYETDDEKHGFFGNFKGEIKINNEIDTSNVTDMGFMFAGATNANPDVSKWDTSNVTDMGGMFAGAPNANPDVSKWDTSNVTNMGFMFAGATNANPDVSKWDTSKVTDMGSMFYNAKNANPDVSKWDTSKVTDICAMFESSGAVELDLSNWDMSKVKDNDFAFKDTSKLEFLSFKGLPNKAELTEFAGKYKVDVLKADGTLEKTEGPFEKDKKYEFNENTGYRVYLAETSEPKVKRIFGNDRYETSVKVYEKYYKPMGIKTVYLANGLTMADALTGAGVAYNSNTGLLLTSANEMINPMKKIIKKMDQLIILGGNTVVNDNIWK